MSHVGVKKYLYHAHAVERLRLDMLDIVDRGCQGALKTDSDALGHLFRGKTVVAPDRHDDGNIDVGEDVGGSVVDRQRAQNQNEQGHHHEGVGPAQS